MALFNDAKFVVYTRGYHPDQLCLGHLVYGSWYKDPVDQMSFCCGFPQMKDSEAAPLTRCNDWRGKVLAEEGGNCALGVDALDFVNLSPKLKKGQIRLLEAESGRRVELRDPAAFLEQKVLSTDTVKKRLQTWLSVARTNYLFKQFLHVRPKIWMLTALYELQGVRSYTLSEKEISAEVGLSSAFVGALGGPPIGGSVGGGRNRTRAGEGFVQQPMVYAARWQLLKASYQDLGRAAEPLAIVLHPDNVYGIGFVMGEDSDEEDNDAEDADVAVLQCAETDPQDSEDRDPPKEYWKAFMTAERLMMDSMQ